MPSPRAFPRTSALVFSMLVAGAATAAPTAPPAGQRMVAVVRPVGAEALGRKMLVLDRLGRHTEASQAAHLYLETFPAGPYAPQAARRVN